MHGNPRRYWYSISHTVLQCLGLLVVHLYPSCHSHQLPTSQQSMWPLHSGCRKWLACPALRLACRRFSPQFTLCLLGTSIYATGWHTGSRGRAWRPTGGLWHLTAQWHWTPRCPCSSETPRGQTTRRFYYCRCVSYFQAVFFGSLLLLVPCPHIFVI